MNKSNKLGPIFLIVAGVLGILFNFMGSWTIPPSTFELNFITFSTILISSLLIFSAILVIFNKLTKIVSWASLFLSILLIVSIYEWLPGVLGVVGAIISLRKSK